MKTGVISIQAIQCPIHSVNTLIVGSGAASLKAAVSLYDRGQHSIAIVTEKLGGGASNNSGSDKQTYYKLSLSGSLPDSPMDMAGDFFAGGCMHGDIALCEAQHSAQAFYELVQAGVPFPHDRYGGYPGYVTDHDPRGRATSAGPLTSHYMFEALSRCVAARGIPVLDRHQVIALLVDKEEKPARILGAVALNLDGLKRENYGLVLFNAVNVILGTGGPGGLYEWSVYPEDQAGSIGMALRIGATAHNLTESQFGLASIKHRWNVSGSYQQVMPRYLSTDKDGNGEEDFLAEFYPDVATMAGAIFCKGYQWPFDPRKIAAYGSSLIDLAVYHEINGRGRRVFLDFTHNPSGGSSRDKFSVSKISPEASEYLRKSDALQPTPIERLTRLNRKAIDLYRDHGIDLSKEYLEIAVCAQHNNGGLCANHWWESNVRHLFPVGEVNGSHGVYRPGGTALNAGQVGALRAAIYVERKYRAEPPGVTKFIESTATQITDVLARIHYALDGDPSTARAGCAGQVGAIQRRMSRHGAQIRNAEEIQGAVEDARRTFEEVMTELRAGSRHELADYFRTCDLALTHVVYLEAIAEYVRQGGKSRGSYVVLEADGDEQCGRLGGDWRFSLVKADAFVSRHILEITVGSGLRISRSWTPVRPIPRLDPWFESVWRDYLDDKYLDEP